MGNGVTVSNTASVSQQQIIDSLTAQLSKANERVSRLEKILQRYESEQLQPLKLRVKELGNAILDACSTYHFEPDLSQPTSSLKELLEINSKWVLDPEISSDAARFAIENQIEGYVEGFIRGYTQCEDDMESGNWTDDEESLVDYARDFSEQLRKEQE